jgi:hypothetical protein
MSEEKTTVTVEEFNAQKAELEKTTAELTKLQKIFEDRQTKQLKKEDVLKKDELLKVLGIEKDPTKEPMDLVNEKLSSLTSTIEQLQKDLKDKDEKLTLKEKQEKAKELAEKAGLNAKLTVKLLDLNGDIEAQLKSFETEYPELKVKKDLGSGSNPGGCGGNTVTVNPYKKESHNLTQQFKLEQSDPALAAKFKAEAGVK